MGVPMTKEKAMKDRISFCIHALILLFTFTIVSTPALAGDGSRTWIGPADWFIYLVILIVLVGVLVSMLIIRVSLAENHWSLSDALSEDVELTLMENDKPVTDPSTGKPVVIKKLYPSSSRLVALVGMIIIMFMFLAFGSFALFGFAKTGVMPESISSVVKFLVTGLTLFAPYAVNKFSKLFEGLTPGR